VVDLFHLPFGSILKNVGLTPVFGKYPHFSKWFNSIENRESWKKALAVGDDFKAAEAK